MTKTILDVVLDVYHRRFDSYKYIFTMNLDVIRICKLSKLQMPQRNIATENFVDHSFIEGTDSTTKCLNLSTVHNSNFKKFGYISRDK